MVDGSVVMISEGNKKQEIKNSVNGNKRGSLILSAVGQKHIGVYRGILELMSRFGYVSSREVCYGFDLDLKAAQNRILYLARAGLVQCFPSQSGQTLLYCLSRRGREAVKRFGVSDELFPFVPNQYQPASHQHHRSITRVYLGLRKLLRDRFLGWTTEQRLKAEGGTNKEKRILDGELFLNIKKTRYKAKPPALRADRPGGEEGEMVQVGDSTFEKWRCGIEVELSLKSPERYKRQFKELVPQVYDSWNKVQHYPMLIFFYTTLTLHDALAKQLKSGLHNFGSCVFYFAQIDEFLENLGSAPVEKFIGVHSKTVMASEIAEVKWVTAQ